MSRQPVFMGSKKAGLPPGSLIHVGQQKIDAVQFRIIAYDQEKVDHLQTLDEALTVTDRSNVLWIDVAGLHEVGLLEKLGQQFGIHPLVLEDILNTEHRPKAEDFTRYVFVVAKYMDWKQDHIENAHVSLVLGDGFVLSFQEHGDAFAVIRERIELGKGRIRKMGADYLAYSLLDSIVDRYFVALEAVGEQIEVFEEDLVAAPDTNRLHEIHALRRELVSFRRMIWPLREVGSILQRGDMLLIREETRLYIGDVHDHVIQCIEIVETFRDLLSGMLDIYLSSMSNRMNAIMQVLTVISTIFIPLTFIAGVYGMNFYYMPELEWPWSYPLVWLVMVGIVLFMLAYFRRKKWL